LLPALAGTHKPLVVDDNYRLQAGDVIVLSVLGEENLAGPLTVGPGGSIALPIVGSIQVVGKSLSEARALIARHYEDLIRRPYVSVALDESASRRRAYVGGMVEKPGSHMLPFGATLTDAVVTAEFSEESDLSQVTLSRTSGELITADLTGLRTAQPLETSIALQWDDRIHVPARDTRLTVLGQVAKPGAYNVPLGRKLTVVEALGQLAGGITDRAGTTARLIRSGEAKAREIDLDRLLKQGDTTQNYEVLPGDVLVVPEVGRITIAGEVNTPITLYPTEGLTLLEAIIRAGGFTPNAGLTEAQIRRGDQVTQVDLEALWRRGDMSMNVALQPGDIVLVPRGSLQEVLIMGAVAKVEALDMRDGDPLSLLKALTLTGRTDASDFSRVTIYREGEIIVANALAAMEKGDMRHNPPLRPGDVVYVPDLGKIALLGAFVHAGLVQYDPKLSFMEYIALGGLGAAGSARLNDGIVIRARPDGTYETTKFDLSELSRRHIPEPIKLMAGDVIFLPPQGAKKDLWSLIRDALFSAASLWSVFDF
jgi:polysaccharide export outer membrane protein